MPTFIDDTKLQNDFVPIRFHYQDGRSSEGGRNVPVYKNLAGFGAAPDDVFVFDVYQLQEVLYGAGLGLRQDGLWDMSSELALAVMVDPFDETFVVTGPSGSPSEGATSIEVVRGGKPGLDDAITRGFWTEFVANVRRVPARPLVGPMAFDVAGLQAALKELRHSVTPLVTGEWSAGTRDALATVIPPGVSLRVLDDNGINITNGPFGQRQVRLHVYVGDAALLTQLKEAVPAAAISQATLVSQNRALPVATTTAPIVTQINRSEKFEPPSTAQPNRGADANAAPPDSIDGLAVRILLRAVGFYDKPLLRTVADFDYVWDTDTRQAWDRWATARGLRYQLTEDRLRTQSEGADGHAGTWMIIQPAAVFDQLGREAADPALRDKLVAAAEEAGVGMAFVETLLAEFQPPPVAKRESSLWPWALLGGAALGVGYIATRKK